jgi:hypothetical protein
VSETSSQTVSSSGFPTVSETPSMTVSVSGTPTMSETSSQTVSVSGTPTVSETPSQNATVHNATALLSKQSDLVSAEENQNVENPAPSFTEQNSYIYIIVGVISCLLCIAIFATIVIYRRKKTKATPKLRQRNLQEANVHYFSKQSEKVSYQMNPSFARTSSASETNTEKNTITDHIAGLTKQSGRTEHCPTAVPSDAKEFSIPIHKQYRQVGLETSRPKFNPIKKVILPVKPAYASKDEIVQIDNNFIFESPNRPVRTYHTYQMYNKRISVQQSSEL